MTNCFDNAGGTPSPQSESRQLPSGCGAAFCRVGCVQSAL